VNNVFVLLNIRHNQTKPVATLKAVLSLNVLALAVVGWLVVIMHRVTGCF
jgi:hypothetical protein